MGERSMTSDMGDWSDAEHRGHEISEAVKAWRAESDAEWAVRSGNRKMFSEPVFAREIFRRLASDAMDAIDQAYSEDGDIRVSFMPIGVGGDVVASIYVDRGGEQPGSGHVNLWAGMSKSRILHLIREMAKPKPSS